LAAGAGVRFGGLKQLAEIDGQPLVSRAVGVLRSASRVDNLTLAVGAQAEEVLAGANLDGVTVVEVPNWEEGMSASLRAGVAALRDSSDAIIVTLADQPMITTATVEAVINAWNGKARAVRAVHAGQPGHPVLLSSALFDAVAELRGDVGARGLLGDATINVDCGPQAVIDVDTREQLDALRKADA